MHYPNSIEDICYDPKHLDEVLAVIKEKFSRYFDKFIETKAGTTITAKQFATAANKFQINVTVGKKKLDKCEYFQEIIKEAISEFEKDRKKYLEILDMDALDEHKLDPTNFKNTVLKNSCPIIHHTLQNKKAKELDKYRAAFNAAKAQDLLDVTRNLTAFAIDYFNHHYNPKTYEHFSKIGDMGLATLDGDGYTAYGVIGGGIKSHFIFKLYPSIFPNRSRESVWALWYLTDRKTFDCKQDSEFLMINVKDNSIQQNYFYPYQLFSYYAYNIYLLLRIEAEKCDFLINRDYRYVIVDSFLSYVAQEHAAEITELSKKDTEYGYGS